MKQERYAISYERFLPTSLKEMKALGWDSADVILFSADAYIDHPAFGTAVIARVLEKMGLCVAVVSQPNWKDDLRDFSKLGTPNLFFAISGGAMDSMVNHYTAAKRLRSDDAYTPGGEKGKRPNRAVITYASIIKRRYPAVPLVIGGIEASLRRLVHYDYWEDTLKPSILLESGADYLIYGMGEKPVKEMAFAFQKQHPPAAVQTINQVAYLTKKDMLPANLSGKQVIRIPSYADCQEDKRSFLKAQKIVEDNDNQYFNTVIVQNQGPYDVVVNPPNEPLTTRELDAIYDLPYTRVPHPRYWGKNEIPAYRMIKDSVTIHRGCFGGCSFCAIAAHQGRFIASRSTASIVKEIGVMTTMPDYKGVISDLGGPSANMYRMQGRNLDLCKKCKRNSCIYPAVCTNLDASHASLSALYKKVRDLQGVRHLYIGSGIRYDLLLASYNSQKGKAEEDYLRQVVSHHVSGRLKVAPEHTEDAVLTYMGKPSFHLFEEFQKRFQLLSAQAHKKQELVPYFISNHPGCTDEHMIDLINKTKIKRLLLEQVQDFTPTPMTRSTAMFYTGMMPGTMQGIFVNKSLQNKNEQNRMFFWYKPENKNWFLRKCNKLKRKR